MVNFARIQNRIYYGYSKASTRLGTDHSIYRSTNGIDPIQEDNLIGDQLISIDENLKYTTPRKYGDMTWQFLPEDGLSLQNYDYMVGETVTYFIADVAPEDRLSPPLCVECNATISVFTPKNELVQGKNPKQQFQPNGKAVVTNCPVSILQHNRMDAANLKLPTSVKLPLFDIDMPDFDDVIIKSGYVVTDNIGRRMEVLSAERTKKSLGFRLIVGQLGV